MDLPISDDAMKAGRLLYSDCRNILSDQEAVAQNRLFYAVDSTEIFSYAFLDRNLKHTTTYSGRLSLLETIAFDDVCLSHLFFSGRFECFLLPPHQLELRRTVADFSDFMLQEVGLVAGELAEVDRVRKKLATRFADLQQKKEALTPERYRHRLNSFFSDIIKLYPSLFVLSRTESFNPEKRLQYFLDKAKFLSFSDFYGTSFSVSDVNRATVNALFAALIEVRPSYPRASNLADAYALAILAILCERAAAGVEVRFVSRSKAICAALEAADLPPAVADGLKGIMRHPREFGLWSLIEPGDNDGLSLRRETVVALKWANSLFADLEGAASTPLENEDEIIARDLRKFGRDVVRLDRSIAAGSIDLGLSLMRDPVDLELLDRMLGEGALGDALRKYYGEVLERLKSRSFKLTGLIRSRTMPEDETRGWVNVIHAEPHKVRAAHSVRFGTVVRHNNKFFMYSIYFFSQGLISYLESLDANAEMPLKPLIRAVRKRRVGGYEGCLCVAFLFAFQNEWDLAYGFADLAIKQVEGQGVRNAGFECFYFRAVCRRHVDLLKEDPASMAASYRDVMEASERRRASLRVDEEDPRYLNELGILLAFYRSSGGSAVEIGSEFLNASPEHIWEKAFWLAKDDDSLRIVILNNLTYFYISLDEVGKALEVCTELEDLIRVNTIFAGAVPPNIIHTMCLVYSRAGKTPPPGIGGWRRELEDYYRSALASPWERREIEECAEELDLQLKGG